MKRSNGVFELVRRAQAGDREALVLLMQQTVPAVAALVKGTAPWLEDPEEIVQDVLYRVLRGLRFLREPERFWGYVAGIARNRIRDVIRRQRPTAPLEEDRESPRGDPVREAIRKEESQLVHQAMEQLGEIDREVVLLRHWAGASYEQIADTLGLTVSAVQSRLFRARRELARRLSGLQETPGAACEEPLSRNSSSGKPGGETRDSGKGSS